MRYDLQIRLYKVKRYVRLRLILALLLLFSAAANSSLFTFHSSLLLAQGLPLIRNFTAAEYGGHNRCYDIVTGDDGTVYVANFEGLLYYDRAQWRMLYTPDISRVTVVYRDSKNTIWLGGFNFFARLERRANGELLMLQIGRGQFEGEVMEIFEDGGKLQFVASDNNLYHVEGRTGKAVPTITLAKQMGTHFLPGVESDVVSVEALKANAKITILDDITQTEPIGGGLQVKVKKNSGLIITDSKGRELYTITEANGLCSNQVAYVAYDGHGMLWGATVHGVFAVEMPSVYSYLLTKDGLSGEVHTITAFDDRIYAGGTNGLYSAKDRKLTRIAEVNNICWKLCLQNDRLLAATSSGIYRIAPGGGVSRLTDNATTAMLVDGDKVYAGEPDGVWCYQQDFRQRSKVSSLQMVMDIRKYAKGNLFLQNVHGKTEGKDPGQAKEPIADLPGYLLKPLGDIEIKAQYRHGDQLWIGGDEVLAVIDTGKKRLARLTDCRTLRFRSITMGSDSVLWGGYGTMPKELPKLGSDEGHLHFFYALDYAPLSGQTLYRYRLNSNAWSAWTEKQDVEFLNLPHGSFTLSIQAQLANGELSDVTSVDFSIAYPLLMRWYMVVLYIIILAYIVWQLFRYRLKRLQRDKIKLEHIVEERTSDLRNAQNELIRQEKMATVGKLTEGLIDRILNPMNYIINFSKMSNDLLKDLKENIDNNKDSIDTADYEDTLDVLDMLSENLRNVDQYGQNTTRTLKAMEEMLKDRTGGYVDMDLLPVLRQNEEMLATYFAKETAQYHIHITFNMPGGEMPLHGNPDMLSKTMMSLLGNAVYAVVKKAQKGTSPSEGGAYVPEITFSATISPPLEGSGEAYILKIRDNGIGIEEKILSKIFDPFFTTKTTDEAAGVGLYLSREIIQNHGGDISVQSVKDEYTEFTITLPNHQTI